MQWHGVLGWIIYLFSRTKLLSSQRTEAKFFLPLCYFLSCSQALTSKHVNGARTFDLNLVVVLTNDYDATIASKFHQSCPQALLLCRYNINRIPQENPTVAQQFVVWVENQQHETITPCIFDPLDRSSIFQIFILKKVGISDKDLSPFYVFLNQLLNDLILCAEFTPHFELSLNFTSFLKFLREFNLNKPMKNFRDFAHT